MIKIFSSFVWVASPSFSRLCSAEMLGSLWQLSSMEVIFVCLLVYCLCLSARQMLRCSTYWKAPKWWGGGGIFPFFSRNNICFLQNVFLSSFPVLRTSVPCFLGLILQVVMFTYSQVFVLHPKFVTGCGPLVRKGHSVVQNDQKWPSVFFWKHQIITKSFPTVMLANDGKSIIQSLISITP